MNDKVSRAVGVLVREARVAFPDVEPSALRLSISLDGTRLEIMAPGLRWYIVPINLAKE